MRCSEDEVNNAAATYADKYVKDRNDSTWKLAYKSFIDGYKLSLNAPESETNEQKVCSNCLHSGKHTFDIGTSLICHLKYFAIPTYTSIVDPNHTCDQFEGDPCV